MFDRLLRLNDGVLGGMPPLRTVINTAAALIFLTLSTLILSYDSVFSSVVGLAGLQVGSVAPQDIRAPISLTYESAVLTERRRQLVMQEVSPVYDPPDPTVSRQQISLLGQVITFIDNIRQDPFGSPEQKANDLAQITALTLDSEIVALILSMDSDTWRAVTAEMNLVLERVMREAIREVDLPQILDQLPTQVSVRFDAPTSSVVIAFVGDLVRPNRFPNTAATNQQREAAVAAVQPESISFERGQVIVREGERIEELDLEAFRQFGLLDSQDRRWQSIIRAFLSSSVVLAGFALYVIRTGSHFPLVERTELLLIMGGLFLIALMGGRAFQSATAAPLIYLYPAAALGLVYVAIIGTDIALIGMIALGFLIGTSSENSLEVATLVAAGGVVGALTLRRSERFNSYFRAGLVVAAVNVLVVVIFHLEIQANPAAANLPLLLVYGFLNGILTGVVALSALYVVSVVFNLPTSLKLVELSQPNQPLLQRLLREAPGTYQHSLQVANLGEQAADAVGANAALVRVAALYHDIGKMLNPAFFVENQADNVNPHDMLNDPYRSASLIISHVTDGEKLARQYRLPQRVRDFILEHHGTTLVSYFYNQAVNQAGDDESVDIEQFKYPGPKPQTRETAILMLADSCESTVRAIKPTNRQEIAEIIGRIFDSRAREGQLDESHLTLDDLTTLRGIFIEMLQAVFHPRINYPASGASVTAPTVADTRPARWLEADTLTSRPRDPEVDSPPPALPVPDTKPSPPRAESRTSLTQELPPVMRDDDDSPLPDVPPLRRTKTNGTTESKPNDVGNNPANTAPSLPESNTSEGDQQSGEENNI